MNTKELVQIIKDEKLYEHYAFRIGHPSSPSEIGTYVLSSCCQGIYQDAKGIWRTFEETDRGGVYESPREYTEEEACLDLLELLRYYKRSRPNNKVAYNLVNRELWWDAPLPEWYDSETSE